MLSGANEVNDDRAGWVQRKLLQHLRSIEGRTIVVMGPGAAPPGAPGRRSRALEVATDLARAGADVRAFDPEVRTSAGGDAGVTVIDDVLASAEHADAVVIASVWEGVTELPLERLRTVMRRPLLVDGWNCVDERPRAMPASCTSGSGAASRTCCRSCPRRRHPNRSRSPARAGTRTTPAVPRRRRGRAAASSSPRRHGTWRAPRPPRRSRRNWVAVEPPHIEPIVLPEAGRSTSQRIQLGVKRVMDVVASLMIWSCCPRC